MSVNTVLEKIGRMRHSLAMLVEDLAGNACVGNTRVSIEGVKNLCPMFKILVCQFRIYSPKKHTFKIYN